jgi:radical SAM superfamily enzyme YgiQ (UPF0313 family)
MTNSDILSISNESETMFLSIKTDVIAFPFSTNQYKYALEIETALKPIWMCPSFSRRIHATMDPQETLSQPCVDYICVGEGEEAILELIQKGSPQGVRNIGHKTKGCSVLEPLRPFTDITKLPFKDYELFDFQKLIDAKDGWVGLTASRGCPFRCTYCLNHKIMGLYKDQKHLPKYYLRRHTAEQVITEIKYLLSRYNNIKTFIFDDDIFTFDKKWLKEFTRDIKILTDISFVCNAHARNI